MTLISTTSAVVITRNGGDASKSRIDAIYVPRKIRVSISEGQQMRLYWYQYFELFGTMLIVVSTAFQLFVLEPTLRQNDQDEMSFILTQTVQATRAATALDNMLILRAMKANSMDVSQELESMENRVKSAKTNVDTQGLRNYKRGKKSGSDEQLKRYVTLCVFLFGSFLMGFGRYGHLRSEHRASIKD